MKSGQELRLSSCVSTAGISVLMWCSALPGMAVVTVNIELERSTTI